MISSQASNVKLVLHDNRPTKKTQRTSEQRGTPMSSNKPPHFSHKPHEHSSQLSEASFLDQSSLLIGEGGQATTANNHEKKNAPEGAEKIKRLNLKNQLALSIINTIKSFKQPSEEEGMRIMKMYRQN